MKFPSNHRRLLKVAWVAAICAVTVGSLLPAYSPIILALSRTGISDKAMHFIAYLVLGILPVLSFESKSRGILTGLSMVVVGGILECMQSFAPGRSVELGDLLANSLGVLCGLLAGLPLRH